MSTIKRLEVTSTLPRSHVDVASKSRRRCHEVTSTLPRSLVDVAAKSLHATSHVYASILYSLDCTYIVFIECMHDAYLSALDCETEGPLGPNCSRLTSRNFTHSCPRRAAHLSLPGQLTCPCIFIDWTDPYYKIMSFYAFLESDGKLR